MKTVQADLLKGGEVRSQDTVEYSFYQYSAPLVGFLGIKRVTIFGLRFLLAIVLVGAAFMLAPQTRWPFGTTIFGCAVFFISLGIVLSARDYFFAPHHQRFEEYLRYLYASSMFSFPCVFPSTRKRAIHWRSLPDR